MSREGCRTREASVRVLTVARRVRAVSGGWQITVAVSSASSSIVQPCGRAVYEPELDFAANSPLDLYARSLRSPRRLGGADCLRGTATTLRDLVEPTRSPSKCAAAASRHHKHPPRIPRPPLLASTTHASLSTPTERDLIADTRDCGWTMPGPPRLAREGGEQRRAGRPRGVGTMREA